MKLKRLLQVMVVSCGVLGLVSCASMHKGDASVSDADGQGPDVQTSGLGENSSFGGMSPQQLLAKHTYYFEYDSSAIQDVDRAAIMANANKIAASPSTKVLLEGHTDPRGSREYNVALGERRANAVADLMKSKGVAADQIRVVSYGAERLAAPGRSESDFQKDRRVVLVYLHE